jgi:hypothetical protein
MKKNLVYGLLIIMTGIIIILSALVIEELYKPGSSLATIALKFLHHIGIALISIGIIGIILDFRDWRKYFQERIADTIIQKEYLKTLDSTELINLQINSLKAFFRVDDIDRKDSFLDFFHKKIHGYIGSPYREDVIEVFSINYSQDKRYYIVEETISYKCRKVGDSIQNVVQWGTSKDSEEEKIEDFSITLQIPPHLYQSPEFKARYPEVSIPHRVYDIKKDVETGDLVAIKEGMGYSLSLDKYKDIDELLVKFHIRYTSLINEPFSWRLTRPAKSLRMIVKHPPELKIDASVFGLDEEECDEEHREGLYILNYDSWLLPNSGVVFYFSATPAILPPQAPDKLT